MTKLPPKALIQRERERLDSRQARIVSILEDVHREQQRLALESQELEVAERVLSRLESEAEIKVLPYTPPIARRGQIPPDDPLDLGLGIETGVSKLERA